MEEFLAILGFMLAAYSIVANDAIQTLGTFLSSNSKRPWWLLWAFACTVLMFVFVYGWYVNDGDVTYGRLAKFPEPAGGLTWLHIIPPIVILMLTRYGIPVSTTFLVLAVFAPGNLGSMLSKSLVGYVVAFFMGVGIYLVITKSFEKKMIATAEDPPRFRWIVLQWISTAFLWSQWLMHDLANIFVYLPRRLNFYYFVFATVLMLALHAIIFARRGGEIQAIVTTKTNTQDIRSATIIDFIYALVLMIFKEYSNMPMSTTWVFLGLLAGRETAISLLLKVRPIKETGGIVFKDVSKASAGLLVSALLAFGLPIFHQAISGTEALAAKTNPDDKTNPTDNVVTADADVAALAALPTYVPKPDFSGEVRCVGSDTMREVMEQVAAALKEASPDLAMTIESEGSATAPPALTAGECELALMSRRMTLTEKEAFRQKFGHDPVGIEIGLDALAVYVNAENPIRGLTLDQLNAIFGAGAAQLKPRWGAYAMPPFPNHEILTQGRNQQSGSRAFFRAVTLRGGKFRDDMQVHPDSDEVVESVGASYAAIGFSGMGYRDQQVRAIAIARNEGGEYLHYSPEEYANDPDPAKRFQYVYDGRYPLSRFMYVYVNKPPGEKLPEPVDETLRFLLSQAGQRILLDAGFIPLTPPLADRQLNKLKADYVAPWYE
ncbi:PstS family phosphate ABC transporter substrate-binding protein [Blastopirellula retiformator]|uniref:Phosphate-binding protein PstS n=1 Tax=Blastopirellula retiformator TaxID=2527970 RepID=A0A5C5V1I8_9BACT|nr:substrate-binding domain-containing protein [Blastopirellula retiformator]TWT31810.1 Phosphate-binding protein PstS precursor [Blastopirellula retiformator]